MSNTISDKLAYLAETKDLIRAAIVSKGVSVSEETTFRDYVSLINQITASGDAESVAYNMLDFSGSSVTSVDNTSTSNKIRITNTFAVGEAPLEYSQYTIHGFGGIGSTTNPRQRVVFYLPHIINAGTRIKVEFRWPEYTVDKTGYNKLARSFYIDARNTTTFSGATGIALVDGTLKLLMGLGDHVIDSSTAQLTPITDDSGEIIGAKLVATLKKDVNMISISGSFEDWDVSGYINATVTAAFASEDDIKFSVVHPIA